MFRSVLLTLIARRSKHSQFLMELSEINWNEVCSRPNANLAFLSVYNKTNKTVNRHTPLINVLKQKYNFFPKPWITKGIRLSIRIKNNLFLTGDADRYRVYRNKLTISIRSSKKNYYQTWNGINLLISRKVNKIINLKTSRNVTIEE